MMLYNSTEDNVVERPESLEIVNRLCQVITKDEEFKKLSERERNFILIKMSNRIRGHLKASNVDVVKYLR
jgi:hypothetical protein